MTTKKSRQITEFPLAWDQDATPYALCLFTPSARTLSELASQDQLARLSSSSTSQSSIPIRYAKAVFVGDVGVGKTSIISRFSRDTFQSSYQSTIGVDYEMERFWILNIPFNLQIWDTAGQERFKCIAAAYYRGANIVVTVFDASKLESLSTCQRWMDDAAGANRVVPLKFLVGTKIDLVKDTHRDKIHEMGLKMAALLGAEYWPVSSKSGENVEAFFRRISTLAMETNLANEVIEELSKTAVERQASLLRLRPCLEVEQRSTKTCNCSKS